MKILLAVWVFALYLVQVDSSRKGECRQCKAGYFAIRQCNEIHDTVCAICISGSYTPEVNRLNECRACSKCAPGSFILKQCSSTADVTCASCDDNKYSHLDSYKFACNHASNLMMGDQPMSSEKQVRTLNLEEGSGTNDSISLLPDDKHHHVTTIPIVIGDRINILDNGTIEEGSGGYTLEIETSSESVESVDNVTASDTTDDVIIPVTKAPKSSSSLSPSTTVTTKMTSKAPHVTTVPSTTTTVAITTTTLATTVKPKTVKPTTVKPTTVKPTTVKTSTTTSSIPTTMKTTKHVSTSLKTTTAAVTTATTTKTGFIDIDDGIIISQTPNDNEDPGIIINQVEVSTKPKDVVLKPGYDIKTTPIASLGNVAAQKVTGDPNEDRVTIGVLVAAILVVAFVFFFIGFLVAKYCNRRRSGTFKVMEKIDGNGLSNGSGLAMAKEHPEKKAGTGIYDEIGREGMAPCPPSDVIVPQNVEDVYAVPNKRKSSPQMVTQLDRIKFIDETTDEELDAREGDKLLTGLRGSQASIPNGKVRHSSEMDDENSPLKDKNLKMEASNPSVDENIPMEDEKSPMITKSSCEPDDESSSEKRNATTSLSGDNGDDDESNAIITNEEMEQILAGGGLEDDPDDSDIKV